MSKMTDEMWKITMLPMGMMQQMTQAIMPDAGRPPQSPGGSGQMGEIMQMGTRIMESMGAFCPIEALSTFGGGKTSEPVHHTPPQPGSAAPPIQSSAGWGPMPSS